MCTCQETDMHGMRDNSMRQKTCKTTKATSGDNAMRGLHLAPSADEDGAEFSAGARGA